MFGGFNEQEMEIQYVVTFERGFLFIVSPRNFKKKKEKLRNHFLVKGNARGFNF